MTLIWPLMLQFRALAPRWEWREQRQPSLDAGEFPLTAAEMHARAVRRATETEVGARPPEARPSGPRVRIDPTALRCLGLLGPE